MPGRNCDQHDGPHRQQRVQEKSGQHLADRAHRLGVVGAELRNLTPIKQRGRRDRISRSYSRMIRHVLSLSLEANRIASARRRHVAIVCKILIAVEGKWCETRTVATRTTLVRPTLAWLGVQHPGVQHGLNEFASDRPGGMAS